jgi:hypothetical protein
MMLTLLNWQTIGLGSGYSRYKTWRKLALQLKLRCKYLEVPLVNKIADGRELAAYGIQNMIIVPHVTQPLSTGF